MARVSKVTGVDEDGQDNAGGCVRYEREGGGDYQGPATRALAVRADVLVRTR